MIIVTNDDRMGKNILHLRKKRRLSQEDFCRIVGMDCQSLDDLEQGNLQEIDAQVFMNISRLFQVEMQALVEENLE